MPTRCSSGDEATTFHRRLWPAATNATRSTIARYSDLPAEILPGTECLKDVVVRMLPYWYDRIVPDLVQGRKPLIVAHGNSLRALVKHLDGLTDQEVVDLNIPTGIPLVYDLDDSLAGGRAAGIWVMPMRRRRPPKPWPARPDSRSSPASLTASASAGISEHQSIGQL